MPTMKGVPVPATFSEADIAPSAPPPAPPKRAVSGFASGSVLGEITTAGEAEPPKEVPVVRSPLTAGLSAPAEVKRKSRLGWILGGAGVLLAAATAAAWFFYFSMEARLFRAIERGELVAPQGKSAYDLFLAIERSGVDISLKQKLRERALPRLQSAGDALLAKRRDAVNYKESELSDLVRICEWAAKISPEDAKALARDAYAKGLAALVAGNAQEALPHFQRALNYDANWAIAANDLGRTYVKLGDHTHAAEAYLRAISSDATWVYPHVNLAGVYLVQKDWMQAEQSYLHAAQLDATLATPWYFLGQVYEAQNQYAQAINAYTKAVALAATRPSSAFAVERVQARIDKLKSRPELSYAPPPPPAWPSRYWVRVFNCDDRCVASLDGRAIAVAGFGQDTGWVEVSRQSPGAHQLVLECFNEVGAITYGFTVRTEQQTVFHQVCGQAGVAGCDNNQPRARGLARQFAYAMMF